jgi:hypothetical protein
VWLAESVHVDIRKAAEPAAMPIPTDDNLSLPNVAAAMP